jgi:hypothetical protein
MPQHALRNTRRLLLRGPSIQQPRKGEQLRGLGMHRALRTDRRDAGRCLVSPLDRHAQQAPARMLYVDVAARRRLAGPPELPAHQKPLSCVGVNRQRDRDESRTA